MLMQTQRTDSIIFISSAIVSTYILFLGASNWLWLSLLVHVLVTSIFSAVIHRYYCHDAYKTNGTLVFIMALIPAAYFYASPVHWRVMHSAHHVHSDTDLDTHVKGFKASIEKMGEALAGPLSMLSEMLSHSWVLYTVLP